MSYLTSHMRMSGFDSIGMMVWMGKCPVCKKDIEVHLDPAEYRVWKTGAKLMQDAFPNMEPGDRELLISGMCDDCWKEMCADDITGNEEED